LLVEKFNLFVLAMASADASDAGRRLMAERLSGRLGRYDRLTLALVGLVVIVIAAMRFVRTGRRLDDQVAHSAGGVRVELILSAALALIVAAFSTYLAVA
jgi:putative membrane protein